MNGPLHILTVLNNRAAVGGLCKSSTENVIQSCLSCHSVLPSHCQLVLSLSVHTSWSCAEPSNFNPNFTKFNRVLLRQHFSMSMSCVLDSRTTVQLPTAFGLGIDRITANARRVRHNLLKITACIRSNLYSFSFMWCRSTSILLLHTHDWNNSYICVWLVLR